MTAKGDLEVDAHHTVEDVGLALGQALKEALGDKAGIRRFASITVPLDEAAVEVALDLSGRPFVVHEVAVPAEPIGTYDPGLTEDFVRAFATAAEMTLHVRLVSGPVAAPRRRGRVQGARECLRDAVRVDRRRRPEHEGNAVTRPTIAVLDYGMGNLRRSRGRSSTSAARPLVTGRPPRPSRPTDSSCPASGTSARACATPRARARRAS